MSNPGPDGLNIIPGAPSEAANHGHTRKSFFSFGDEGVTATVSASGRLLRISRYFPGHKTGFCVDEPGMPRPWLVHSRLETLIKWAEAPSKGRGIGPSIDGSSELTIINDRWPIFEGTWEDGTPFKLQYVAYKGTIYQRFDFTHKPTRDKDNQTTQQPAPELQLTPDLLIRNLDFVQRTDAFNEAIAKDESYRSSQGDGGNCVIREHFNDTAKGLLSIHAFDDNRLLQFVQLSETKEEAIPYAIRVKDNGSISAPFTVIVAYTLDYVQSDTSACNSLPMWKDIAAIMSNMLVQHHAHSWTDGADSTLDLVLGRNLEYILSVCCIPVSNSVEGGLPCFALTCGDVDSHRVATPAASYYIFQLLVLALDYFERFKFDAEVCKCGHDCLKERIVVMQKRIFRICQGHIAWLVKATKTSGSLLCPNYWMDGTEISDWKENYWLSKESLVNAPFQIIKACEFWKLSQTRKFWGMANEHQVDISALSDDFKGPIEAWIGELDRINKLGLYAFPRYDNESTDSFYLTDHTMIWRAIRSAEMIYCNQKFIGPTTKLRYSSQVLQRHMTQRFTTENPQSKKRMIAVTRSLVQTRFLLRSRDTALFSAVDMGFFEASGSQRRNLGRPAENPLWTNTVDCQKYHEDNEDFLNWRDPLRLALSIIMAKRKQPMNSLSEDEMYEYAISVLLQCTSANYLLPGWLGENNSPAIYEAEQLRDRYWEVTFEIPFLLWKYCHESLWNTTIGPDEQKFAAAQDDLSLILNEVRSMSKTSGKIHKMLRDGQLTGSRTPKASVNQSMKRVQPFNNVVDEENIVELQDEWLYNKPSFFVENSRNVNFGSRNEQVAVDDKGVAGRNASFERGKASFVGIMADVPKPKPQHGGKGDNKKKSRLIRGVVTSEDIRRVMKEGRSMDESKKRFWSFFSDNMEGTRACLETVFEAERKTDVMKDFFQKHKSCVSRFTEETVAVLNMWTTEVHLSFYCLTSAVENESCAAASKPEKLLSLPVAGGGAIGKPLTKVAMSFQFEGDLFDRYWTCRFLETDPQSTKLKLPDELSSSNNVMLGLGDERLVRLNQLTDRIRVPDRLRVLRRVVDLELLVRPHWTEMMGPLENGHGNNLREDSWEERRVLEIYLFGQMLQKINGGAKNILHESWLSLRDESTTSLENKQRGLSNLEEAGHDVFLITTAIISRERAEKVQRILRTTIANLEENLAQIALWQNREKDRQAERPQWTFHDENRFRVIIQKLQVSNDHGIWELNRLHVKITKLEESLVKKLEMIRSDQEDQRGRETQLFTYVTVVFLPLGFATGIFSMSEAPAPNVVGGMIALASVAFIWIFSMMILVSAEIVGLPKFLNWGSLEWSAWAERRKAGLETTCREAMVSQRGIWEMDKTTWKVAMAAPKAQIRGKWEMVQKRWRMRNGLDDVENGNGGAERNAGSTNVSVQNGPGQV